MVVYKYKLLIDTNNVKLPLGAKIVHVGNQNETPCMWVLINEKETRFEIRNFAVVCSGVVFDDSRYISPVGTALLDNGAFVVHVFEFKGQGDD